MRKVQKLGTWILHTLSKISKLQRSTIAAILLARHKHTGGHKERFIYRNITGDYKWCLHSNIKYKKAWIRPDKQATPRVK